MSDPVAAALREVATPALYRRNAFRVTGLPTGADRPAVRRQRQKVTTMLQVGADIDLGHDLPVDAADVARAFDLILGDPRRRLVDEMFWLWDAEDAACGCARSVHREHDAAVRAHSAALDLEAAGPELTAADRQRLDRLWPEAMRLWRRHLRRDAVWEHVRRRIAALDDRQLDESAVRVLRDEAPGVLVRPLVQLAAGSEADRLRLVGYLAEVPASGSRVDDLREEAAEPLFEALATTLTEVSALLESGGPEATAAAVYRDVMPKLPALNLLVPADRHRRTETVRTEIAVLLNNCAARLIERDGPRADRPARRWLASARTLAGDVQTLTTIGTNEATLDEIVTVFRTIEQRVAGFVAAGRPDLARQLLDDLRRRLGDAPGAAEIDRMLAGLGAGRSPAYRRPVRIDDALRAGRRRAILAWLVILGLVVAFVVWVNSDDVAGSRPVRVYGPEVDGNAAVGTCIATRDGWYGDVTEVPSVPCEDEHWGEILGYPEIGSPDPWPGDELLEQRTRYECARLRWAQNLTSDAYTTSGLHPTAATWRWIGLPTIHASCVVHRADDRPLRDAKLVDPDRRPPADLAVPLPVLTYDVGDNPPPGSCVAGRDAYRNTERVDFVSCDRPHWGEILGYPVLYPGASAWPGDAAVRKAADTACARLGAARRLGADFAVRALAPGADFWTDARDRDKYAICTAVRTDDGLFTGRLP